MTSRIGGLTAVTAMVILASSLLLYATGEHASYAGSLFESAMAAITGTSIFSRVLQVLLAIYSAAVFATLAGTLGAYFLRQKTSSRAPACRRCQCALFLSDNSNVTACRKPIAYQLRALMWSQGLPNVETGGKVRAIRIYLIQKADEGLPMGLSEEERRRLEMLEKELASSDPGLDQKLQVGAPGGHPREAAAMARGVLAFIAAFALVIVGIATELVVVGAAGFLLMVAAAHWFLRDYHFQDWPERQRKPPEAATPG